MDKKTRYENLTKLSELLIKLRDMNSMEESDWFYLIEEECLKLPNGSWVNQMLMLVINKLRIILK